jgi:flagellar assembly protein FliH
LYNKIFKSSQVNIGIPVQIRAPLNYQNIKRTNAVHIGPDFESVKNKVEDAQEVLEKTRLEAESIIREAELEADRIIENARKKAEELKSLIEEESRQKGYEEGYEEAKKQHNDLIREAEAVKENALKEYKEVLEGIEKDAVDVIIGVSRKVIDDEINLNQEYLLNLVRQAFEKCSNRENIAIKVSSKDYEFIEENKDKILSMTEGIDGLDIIEDKSLKPGDLILETAYGSVDSGVNTKIKKIEEAFEKVLNK